MTLPREFSLIARHFGPLAGPGALGLADDAALLDPPAGKQLVLAADAMVEGVHFLAADPPETVGRKLLRVNLSDLAAMGAAPLGYLMTTAFGRGMDEAWIAGFAAGLAEDQRAFGLSVLGGDTVVTPGPACFSLTILGSVEPGRAIRRAGARPGDEVWVSGSIGDGALGLLVLAGQVAVGMPPSRPSPASAGEGVSDPSERLRGPLHAGHAAFLAERYRLPQPRLALGQAVAAHVSAGMDVSDGLVQDLGHLCRAAGCGAEIAAA
ncbi:MAG TPA: thiamine-phosphate kinase, partial [Acetobacteraceae bacterium]|nr:thiamine-phosphate kinase [Acetobacteraceae bacterium]